MKRIGLALAAFIIAVPALAQEPVGCDKFKWPLDRERALLAQAAPAKSAGDLQLVAGARLTLVPAAEAKLPVVPTRAPKDGSYAGFLRLPAPPSAGTYRVTLSANAWIEVVQEGEVVKAGVFSGVGGCEGLRKSVKFELAARPFIVELSGMATPEINVVVTPD